ncbi:MAG TPA: flagellar basal body-associated FliL family protein [Aliidongia sp.]|uniref:flagellar basal body-associated FliL family protein n=1 Tax=Aliidongia sp. TaxID=1914230 RepID=UPI002DDD4785|nr:flagellar basal body-associated FliL family protein [Aliidongia sp.]HEV2674076.1 flagellar basal body-associated FliL family protein [Aliidongia sp.]
MRRGMGVLILVGGIVLVAGAGVAMTVTGFLPKLLGMKPPEGTIAAEQEKAKPVQPLTPERYFDLRQPIMIALDTQGHGNRVLQLGISLLMETREDASAARDLTPRVIDAIQVYVRSLPLSESGSVGKLSAHRGDLLARINAAIAPLKADELNLSVVQQQ